MNPRLLLPLLFAAIAAVSCGDNSTTPPPTVGPELGEPFTIEEGQSVTVAGTDHVFTFGGVIWDTRCPKNELCNWPGYADIHATWSPEGEYSFLPRLIVSGAPSAASTDEYKLHYRGYTFRFLGLTPVPPDVDNSELYVATILITENEPKATVNGQVKIGGLPDFGTGLSSPTYIKHSRIVGDTLELIFSIPEHSDRPFFFAYMEPVTFDATWPPSANIYFRKLSQSGVGDAFDTVAARFDLTSVKELCRSTFGNYGPMILNLHSRGYDYSAEVWQDVIRTRLIYDDGGASLNWPPMIEPIAPKLVSVGSFLPIQIHAFDPNGTDISLTLENAPANWRLQYDYSFPDELIVFADSTLVGTHEVRLIASDGELADTLIVEVTIQ